MAPLPSRPTPTPAAPGSTPTSTSPTVARPGPRDRRSQILAAAAELFALRGFHGVSVDEIGAAVGVSGPALYHHFAGKEALLAELLLDVSRRLLDGAEQCAQHHDPSDARGAAALLASMVERQVAFALTEPALITVHTRHLDLVPEPARTEVRRLQRAYVERWVEATIAARGADRFAADDPERAATLATVLATFGLINSTPFSARIAPPAMAVLLHRLAMGALLGR